MAKPGYFLTLEGIDGAGKSTHLPWLAEQIQARGIDLLVTREPGGTPLGEELRQIVLKRPMHPDTELMLIFAARRQHLEQKIWPALAQGQWVLCDRFTDATYAYQGGGRELDLTRIAALETWTHSGFQPDRTWLFDVPLEVAQRRRQNAERPPPDRFEREQIIFFERVRRGYLQRVAAEQATNGGDRFYVLDASLSIAEIQELLQRDLMKLIANYQRTE